MSSMYHLVSQNDILKHDVLGREFINRPWQDWVRRVCIKNTGQFLRNFSTIHLNHVASQAYM